MKSTEKIAIGWIDSGVTQTGFVAHLAHIMLNRSEQIEDVVVASGPYLTFNRNRMVKLFLETGIDWLFSIDSDICVQLDSFDKLVEAADSETRPVVGGKYYLPFDDGKVTVVGAQNWTDKTDPNALGDWVSSAELSSVMSSENTVLEGLHSVGIGYSLIHRDVFLGINALHTGVTYPWFKDEYSEKWGNWASDDIYFWKQCRDLGINISLQTQSTSEHLKQFKLSDDSYLRINPDLQMHQPHINSMSHPQQRMSWWTKSKKRK